MAIRQGDFTRFSERFRNVVIPTNAGIHSRGGGCGQRAFLTGHMGTPKCWHSVSFRAKPSEKQGLARIIPACLYLLFAVYDLFNSP
jgi:hypothetical protein